MVDGKETEQLLQSKSNESYFLAEIRCGGEENWRKDAMGFANVVGLEIEGHSYRIQFGWGKEEQTFLGYSESNRLVR